MSLRITAVVVVYNKNCSDSLTCESLEKVSEQMPEVLIVDNSTSDFNIVEFCNNKGWRYCSMNGNAGLSKAYNRAIDTSPDTDIFVWLDDDTALPADYFVRLAKTAQENPEAELCLPVVKSGDDIISPSTVRGARVIRVKDLSELCGEITAINSGLAARRSVYDGYRYDEDLFLDLVDHKFMKDCAARGIAWAIIEGEPLEQTFFGDTNKSKKAALSREKIFAKDFRVFGKKTGKSFIVTELQLLRRRLKIEKNCR
ncbi:MAG: glycosyltransferase [Clostridia bacterium]|nr:glycosyltransferase [Clostridia bacterium]